MKLSLTLAVILLVVFFGGLFAVNAQSGTDTRSKEKLSKLLSTSYDKKKDVTTVRLKRSSITKIGQEKDNTPNFPLHQMDLEVFLTQKGQAPGAPVDSVVLNFYAVAGNYVFLRPAQVMAVIDRDAVGEDRAIELGMSNYKSNPPKFNTVYEESLSVTIPAEALTRMAKANALELFVGPVGYRLTENQLSAIRDLASFLPDRS